jgi:hypothetical protein
MVSSRNTNSDKGLRAFLKEAWNLWKERQYIHKALRILNKQEWSIEFLTSLFIKAAKHFHEPLEMTIVGPGQVSVTIKSTEAKNFVLMDDDVMNHLDDDVFIRQFMERLKK